MIVASRYRRALVRMPTPRATFFEISLMCFDQLSFSSRYTPRNLVCGSWLIGVLFIYRVLVIFIVFPGFLKITKWVLETFNVSLLVASHLSILGISAFARSIKSSGFLLWKNILLSSAKRIKRMTSLTLARSLI